jgi:hypothetical protein
MADLNCFNTLKPFLIRLKVLAQVQPGDVIVLDDAGQWMLQPNSTMRSGMRKLWSFMAQKPIQSQRSAFLKSATETVDLLIRHCYLLMRTVPFLKAIDSTSQSLSPASVASLSAGEVGDFEFVLQTLQTVSTHVHDGLRGLVVMKNNEPYASDLTWCSELTVVVIDAIVQFLDRIYRRLGLEYAQRVLPFLKTKATGQSVTATATSADNSKQQSTTNTWAPPTALLVTAATAAPLSSSAAASAAAAAPAAAATSAAAAAAAARLRPNAVATAAPPASSMSAADGEAVSMSRTGSGSDLSSSQVITPTPQPKSNPTRNKH